MTKLQCHTCTHTVYLHECTCYVDYMFIGILVIEREVGKEGVREGKERGREREREKHLQLFLFLTVSHFQPNQQD